MFFFLRYEKTFYYYSFYWFTLRWTTLPTMLCKRCDWWLQLSQELTGDWCTALSHHTAQSENKSHITQGSEFCWNYQEVVNGALLKFRFHTNAEGTDTRLSLRLHNYRSFPKTTSQLCTFWPSAGKWYSPLSSALVSK